jgi:hypothetical protein
LVFIDFDQERHVVGDARNRPRASDLRAEKGDPVAKLCQEPVKRGVELVAEASTTVGDEFLEDSVRFENDRDAAVEVEVLEGNRAEVGGMEFPQGFGSRALRGRSGNAGQVV